MVILAASTIDHCSVFGKKRQNFTRTLQPDRHPAPGNGRGHLFGLIAERQGRNRKSVHPILPGRSRSTTANGSASNDHD